MSLTFEIRESHVCAELGLSLDEVRRRRMALLEKGVHWDYVKKRVLLTRKGAWLLRCTREAVLPPPDAKNGAQGDSEPPRRVLALLPEKTAPRIEFTGELIVWSTPARNFRLVVAYVPGQDPLNPMNLVSVTVRDNRNFLKGMKIPGPGRRLHQTGETSFDLQGACPRWRGRW